MHYTNAEANAAKALFEDTEGIDIYHAAAVATASLQQAVENGTVKAEDVVMLNITGGGERRFQTEHELYYLKPNHIFRIDFTKEEVKQVLAEMK